jgi:hypothetical protein
MQIKAGADALARGDFIEIDEAEIEEYLDGLIKPDKDTR